MSKSHVYKDFSRFRQLCFFCKNKIAATLQQLFTSIWSILSEMVTHGNHYARTVSNNIFISVLYSRIVFCKILVNLGIIISKTEHSLYRFISHYINVAPCFKSDQCSSLMTNQCIFENLKLFSSRMQLFMLHMFNFIILHLFRIVFISNAFIIQ